MAAWLLALALLPAADVPIDVQVPALLKALGFERNLRIDSDRLVIGVVYDPSDAESADTVDRILRTHKELTRMLVKGKRVEFVPVPYIPGARLELGESRVLVASSLPRDALALVARQSAEASVLTFTTTAAYLDDGLAVGMELVNGRPGFVVNLAAASDAGASFEASFLALCRIVERK